MKRLIAIVIACASLCYGQSNINITFTQSGGINYANVTLTQVDGIWYAMPTVSGGATPVYTNSLHEINMTLWSNSVAEYLFDDVNSLSWTNGSTGNTNDTSYIGTNAFKQYSGYVTHAYTNGFTNGYIRLDGFDDYLRTLSVVSLSNYTYYVWVKLITKTTSDTILNIGTSAGNTGYFLCSFDNSTAGRLRFIHVGASGLNIINADMPTNQWVFCASTWDGAYHKAFTNGVLVSSNSYTTVKGGAYRVCIGEYADGGSFAPDAYLDSALVSSQAMTQVQLQDVMNKTQYRLP